MTCEDSAQSAIAAGRRSTGCGSDAVVIRNDPYADAFFSEFALFAEKHLCKRRAPTAVNGPGTRSSQIFDVRRTVRRGGSCVNKSSVAATLASPNHRDRSATELNILYRDHSHGTRERQGRRSAWCGVTVRVSQRSDSLTYQGSNRWLRRYSISRRHRRTGSSRHQRRSRQSRRIANGTPGRFIETLADLSGRLLLALKYGFGIPMTAVNDWADLRDGFGSTGSQATPLDAFD